jgi:coenzyme F420-reducing hydrogenase delta subunit
MANGNKMMKKKIEMIKEWMGNSAMEKDEREILKWNENEWNEMRKMRKRNEYRNGNTGSNNRIGI